MELCGFENLAGTKKFDFPVKQLRYAVIEKQKDREGVVTERFFVKALGFKDRIEVSVETHKVVIDALLEI